MKIQSAYNAGFYDGVRNFIPRYLDNGAYMEGHFDGKEVRSARDRRDITLEKLGLDPKESIDLSDYDFYISIFGRPRSY